MSEQRLTRWKMTGNRFPSLFTPPAREEVDHQSAVMSSSLQMPPLLLLFLSSSPPLLFSSLLSCITEHIQSAALLLNLLICISVSSLTCRQTLNYFC